MHVDIPVEPAVEQILLTATTSPVGRIANPVLVSRHEQSSLAVNPSHGPSWQVWQPSTFQEVKLSCQIKCLRIKARASPPRCQLSSGVSTLWYGSALLYELGAARYWLKP
jgi:hypothetical protein